VDALHAIQSDDQLANRFEPFGLPPWRDGEEYRQLLSTLEAVLPLRRPSDLSDSALAGKIFSAADGILGEIITLVTRAAVMAVNRGIETITATVVDDCGFVSASQRRHAAV
jgi:hypothetical protein